MCIIERKTYIYPDERRVVETTKPCPRAVGSRICNHVQRRSVEAIRVVETTPTRDNDDTSSDGVIVTEGRDGRQRVYRDLSKRSSNNSSVRHSRTMSDRSPVSPPSSTSSPAYVEVKPPPAPTPPPAAQGFPALERTRAPYGPPTSPPDPKRIITSDGTAIYDRPPSLELPRASDNERPTTADRERRSSVSSTTAEIDETDEPGPSRPPLRRPNISIDTTLRPSTSSSSPSVESPGLSNLPRLSNLRRDSGKDVPKRDSRTKPERRRTYSDRRDRSSRIEQDRRLQEETDRLVRIERERLAAAERRRSTQDPLADEASRERHRQEAAAALEGQHNREEDEIELNRNADLNQMARERAASSARRRESDQAQRYVDDQLRRDADARARYQSGSDRGSPLPRRLTGENISYTVSPLSARSPSRRTQPVLHQYPSTRRRDSQTIRDRGEDVIAREQARAASERMNTAFGGMTVEDRYDDDEYELVDDYYVSEGQDRRRRRRRDGERERRPQQFYR